MICNDSNACQDACSDDRYVTGIDNGCDHGSTAGDTILLLNVKMTIMTMPADMIE